MKNVCHLGDCMEHMRELPDNYYSLSICDPPYGIGKHETNAAGTIGDRIEKNGSVSRIKRSEKTDKNWDVEPPSENYFVELTRVSENQIIWGANHFSNRFDSSSSCWIVWDKLNGKTYQSDCELAYASFKTAVRKFSYMWSGMIQGEQNKGLVEKRIHPTQKPVALYKWLLSNYAKPGDTIFDSHVGSGSIRIACHDLDFDFEGCEIDADYHAAQEARYQKHCDQLKLF